MGQWVFPELNNVFICVKLFDYIIACSKQSTYLIALYVYIGNMSYFSAVFICYIFLNLTVFNSDCHFTELSQRAFFFSYLYLNQGVPLIEKA